MIAAPLGLGKNNWHKHNINHTLDALKELKKKLV